MPQHVLHVEDDTYLKDLLKVSFTLADVSVKLQQFISSEEALPYIEQHGPEIDLFLLDIRVPGPMSGLQIAQWVRDHNWPGYIVLTSAYGAPSKVILDELRAEFYPKPWHIVEVTQKLLQFRLRPEE